MKDRLRAVLGGVLPGRAAHAEALPPGFERRPIAEGVRVAHAAVLVSLYPRAGDGRILFPMIRRPDGIEPHAGQVGLPGGAREHGEDSIRCALREAHEEVGIDPVQVEVLGRLTPITIPVSCYRVETIVGWVAAPPRFVIQESEVLKVVLADPQRLANEGPTAFVDRVAEGRRLRFPAYAVEGERVWGATALILAEFLQVWRTASGPHGR